MTLPSSAVATFRTHWAARFVDTVTVTRTTGRGVINETTGAYDNPTVTTLYTGSALIRPVSDEKTSDYGGEQVTTMLIDVFVPHDTDGLLVDDVVTVDASVYDDDLTGTVGRVVGVDRDTYHTRQRIRCLVNLGSGDAV